MLRLNPFTTKNTRLHTDYAYQPQQSELTSELLHSVFNDVARLGIDEIISRCNHLRDGQTVQDFSDTPWLFHLSNEALSDIHSIIDALAYKTKTILESFMIGGNRNEVIHLFSSEYLTGVNRWQLDIIDGDIYRTYYEVSAGGLPCEIRDSEPLMKFAAFLNMTQQSNRALATMDNMDFYGKNVEEKEFNDIEKFGHLLKSTTRDGSNIIHHIFFEFNCASILKYCRNKELFYLRNKELFTNDKSTFGNTLRQNLKDEDLIILDKMFTAISSNIENIFASLKKGGKCSQEMHIYGNYHTELVVYNGSFYIKSRGITNSKPLMKFVNLFDLCNEFNLFPSDMTNMNFTQLNLQGKYFRNLKNISYSDFSFANLNDCNMGFILASNTDFSNANMRSADMYEVSFINSNFSNADLRAHKLITFTNRRDYYNFGSNYTSFAMCDLTGANFYGAKFNSVSIEFANLYRTNFSNSELDGVDFMRCTHIDTANFHHTFIRLIFDREKYTDDELFNHLNNPETGSLLTLINQIDEQYVNKEGKIQKLDLMHQVIVTLEDLLASNDDFNINDYAEALMDIWMSNPLYRNDHTILAFIREHILAARIATANTSRLIVATQGELELLVETVKYLPQEQQRIFMLQNNGFFIQLMLLCTAKGVDLKLQQEAQLLYSNYLALDELNTAKRLMEEVIQSDIGLIDGPEVNPITGEELSCGVCFAFYKQAEGACHILILARKQILAMLRTDSSDAECMWSALCYATGESPDQIQMTPSEEHDLTTLFNVFSLFANTWQFKQNNATFIKLLDTLNLHYANEAKDDNYLAMDYKPLFLEALNNNTYPTKLTGHQHEMTLSTLFKPVLHPYNLGMKTYLEAVVITQEHYIDIMQIYDLAKADRLTQAQTFFSLAAVFARYTSSSIFGQEQESPQAIRAYAGALLIAAYQLDPTVFGLDAQVQKTYFNQLIQKMLGAQDENGRPVFTCTAVLSKEMLRHTQVQPDFKAIADKLTPPAWH